MNKELLKFLYDFHFSIKRTVQKLGYYNIYASMINKFKEKKILHTALV